MRRRTFNSFAGAAFLPLPGNAQGRVRPLRLGILQPASTFSNEGVVLALQQLGYSAGQTLILNEQFANRNLSSLSGLAMDMAQLKPDVILTIGSSATRAVLKATVAVPIVFFGNFDPVLSAFAKSLAQPGGNATGILIAPEGTFAAKKVELIKETVPAVKRIAILLPDDPDAQRQVDEARPAASQLGIELVAVDVRDGEYEEAFVRMVAAQAEALFVGAHTYFMRDRKTVIGLAAKYRLPAIYEWSDQVRDGGLMAYGPNRNKLYSHIALYIDRIFKGEKPGDLPVELPASPELSLNLGTARALGLMFPAMLLSRADERVE